MKKNKTSFTMSLILLAVSVIFTLLVAFVGKAPVGPENSKVGFAALNAALHDQFGYNTVFYGISSVLGYLTILTALINCVGYLANLIKKKDLRMVRADLTATLGIYILLAVLYLVFEFVVINYRPVILEEGLEASFPSTHSMLAIAVMFSAAQQVRTGMKESGIRNILILLCVLTGNIDLGVGSVVACTGAVAPAEEITDDQFKHEMQIDLFGTFICAREFGKEMIKAGYGRIINIASMYGLVGNLIVGSAPYHAAKGGVVNLTRALAAEWGKYGITVNAICPGYFYTPLTQETLDSDFFQANAKTMIPEERYGNEGELDTAAIFLASEASSYVTGVNLPVDGGYTCM